MVTVTVSEMVTVTISASGLHSLVVRHSFPAVLAVTLAAGLHANQPDAFDAAIAKYWNARNTTDAAKAANDVLKTGAPFNTVYARLKRGRPYSTDVATGIVGGRRGEFSYTLDVPVNYDASRGYGVRFQLHGGVGAPREASERRGRGGIGRLAGAEQIYVLPAAWNEEPWWSDGQVDNLHAILDMVKRTYNVDENRVVVSGVSDGGTGAYFVAMRDTTPYAAFLPLNGYILVLNQVTRGIDGDLFPNNLRNKPFFVVNGGRDPLYPMAAVEPTLEHLARGGVDITYKPQPQAGHDTSWWPVVKDSFEAFVHDHPRVPLPDRLTWTTSDPRKLGRAHWLTIDALGTQPGDASDLPDLNDFVPAAATDIGFRLAPGLKVERVIKGSMADRAGLEHNDVIQRVGTVAIRDADELIAALKTYQPGSALSMTVARSGRAVELSGTFDPQIVRGASSPMFKRTGRWGQVELVRTSNTVQAKTRGVSEFSLLLSPDQFDFARPVKVIVNDRVVFDGNVQKSVATLMKWAAEDNDRTMLFGAALKIKVQ
jgi:poly(3-hydroxybutyrate) depolymerase